MGAVAARGELTERRWTVAGRSHVLNAPALSRPTLLACALLAASLYALPLVHPVPLLDPDEGLHAAITSEMIARGDYIVPRFLGEPFLDKPILFFWSQAASMRVVGETEAGARLPGLVFGLLGALTTGWLAAVVLGHRGGWLAAPLYATMLVPMALAEVPVHDIALVPFTSCAVLALWRASRAPTTVSSMGWSLGAGIALGLAVLTKGLPGVAIVGLAHGTVLALERRWSVTIIAGGILALVAAGAIAAPWYLAMEHLNPRVPALLLRRTSPLRLHYRAAASRTASLDLLHSRRDRRGAPRNALCGARCAASRMRTKSPCARRDDWDGRGS